MGVRARYTAGDGVLLGAGLRWLLLTDPGDDEVVDLLWEVLETAAGTRQDVSTVLLAIADDAFGGAVPALVYADLTPGSVVELTRGRGRAVRDTGSRVLSLDSEGLRTPSRRAFRGGVVPASAVELEEAEQAPAGESTGRADGAGTGPDAQVHRTDEDREVGAPAEDGVGSPRPDDPDGSGSAGGAEGSGSADGPAAPGRPLIDGIPPEILRARGPDGPPLPRPRPAPADSVARDLAMLQEIASLDPAPDSVPRMDLDQIVRPPTGAAESSAPRDTSEPDPRLMERLADPPAADVRASGPDAPEGTATTHRPDHLRAAPRSETVQAVWCPRGHMTRPDQPLCRVCRAQVAPQHPQQVPQPTLGGLRLPTGEVVPLDRGVVVGRQPHPLDDDAPWPHLVTLPGEYTYISRMHLHLTLSGWDLVVRDLGSRGGTTLRPPGGSAETLHPQRPRLVPPGSTLDLAETCALKYEVGPAAGEGSE